MRLVSLTLLLLTSVQMLISEAGYSSQGHRGNRKGSENIISPKQTLNITQEDPNIVLLDVRTAEEYESETGHLQNAILIPIHDLENRVGELDRYKDKKIIAYCAVGGRSGRATSFLSKKGFTVFSMEGGILEWNKLGLPVQKSIKGVNTQCGL